MDDIASYTATAEELLAATDVVNAACARAQLQRPRASAEQIVMHVAVQQEVARVRERARAHDELEQAAWTLHGLYEELWAARDGLHETISFLMGGFRASGSREVLVDTSLPPEGRFAELQQRVRQAADELQELDETLMDQQGTAWRQSHWTDEVSHEDALVFDQSSVGSLSSGSRK